MMAAAVAKGSTTQSTTSSTIRVVETEDQSNTECQKVLASRSDRHGTIADMDTCRAIVPTTGHEDRDGWTQQVVDWKKKFRGAKSGHQGHLYESEKLSERRIKELASIERLASELNITFCDMLNSKEFAFQKCLIRWNEHCVKMSGFLALFKTNNIYFFVPVD